jgi:hypothetical protein
MRFLDTPYGTIFQAVTQLLYDFFVRIPVSANVRLEQTIRERTNGMGIQLE